MFGLQLGTFFSKFRKVENDLEFPDTTPVDVGVHRNRLGPINSIAAMRQAMLELNRQAALEGNETLDDAMDFAVDDGYDDPELTPAEKHHREMEEGARLAARDNARKRDAAIQKVLDDRAKAREQDIADQVEKRLKEAAQAK